MTRFLLLLLIFPFSTQAQQKEEIIKAIIKINRLENADKGPSSVLPLDTSRLSEESKTALFEIPNKFDNHKNFQALRKLINHDELALLTSHENPVVRLFAIRQLIEERDYNFDFLKAFQYELYKHDTITCRFYDMIEPTITYRILLEDLSGDWNYAKSTDQQEDLKFLTIITQAIDSFILFSNFNFPDHVYQDIFDRQKFSDSANSRILELIRSKYNFWAFNYLKNKQPQLYDSIRIETINTFNTDRKKILADHPHFFEWFLRYLITSHHFKISKLFIQELKDKNYSKESIDWMLMGIDKGLIEKVK